jgi:hypothetical protein
LLSPNFFNGQNFCPVVEVLSFVFTTEVITFNNNNNYITINNLKANVNNIKYFLLYPSK